MFSEEGQGLQGEEGQGLEEGEEGQEEAQVEEEQESNRRRAPGGLSRRPRPRVLRTD